MMNVLLVAAGGAAGSVARYLTGVGYGRLFGLSHPYLATMIINVLGGLLMGLLVGLLALKVSEGGERWRLLLAVGVLGGFTTFSTFALEADRLLKARDFGMASFYILGSVVFSIVALMLGLLIARKAFA